MAKKQEKTKRKFSLYTKVSFGLIFFMLIWSALSLLSKGFCDFYVRKIFPVAVNTIGRFSSLFSFTLGDVLIVLTVILILSGILMLILSPFFRNRVWRLTKKFWKFMFMYILIVLLLLSLNLTVLYHTTSMRESEVAKDREYTNIEYGRVYNYLVDKVNELYKQISRDENGIPVLKTNLHETAVAGLKSMSSIYPQLDGYYPGIKYMGFSDIFSQEYVGGYYFPITMEPTINANMNDIKYPVVVTHELIHLKGIIREDEANFLAALACMGSDDVFFRYSGYLDAFMYMDSYDGFPDMPDYFELHVADRQVYKDDVFISEEKWEKIEETAVLPTEVVNSIGSNLIDTSLKVNGVEEGIYSYNEMVTLLLNYFLDKE